MLLAMRFSITVFASVALLANAVPTHGCTMVGCLYSGVELRRDFVVRVTHADKPLLGVDVEVTSNSEKAVLQFTGKTGADGSIKIARLQAGDYWVKAEFLGITAGVQCFHVSQVASRKAKRSLTYEWGDMAPATRKISGSLIDSHPSKDGTPLENLLRKRWVEAPIDGASIRLREALTAKEYSTTASQDGTFSIDQVPDGIYVIHVEGGISASGKYASTDQLIRLSHTSTADRLLLRRTEAAGGSCGGWGLEF
jgi:hypothetical protein